MNAPLRDTRELYKNYTRSTVIPQTRVRDTEQHGKTHTSCAIVIYT